MITVTKKRNGDNKIVKATKMTADSTGTVVLCIGTKRDCHCHRYLLLWQSHFFACRWVAEAKISGHGTLGLMCTFKGSVGGGDGQNVKLVSRPVTETRRKAISSAGWPFASWAGEARQAGAVSGYWTVSESVQPCRHQWRSLSMLYGLQCLLRCLRLGWGPRFVSKLLCGR